MMILGFLPISTILLIFLVLPGGTRPLGDRFLEALLLWGTLIVFFTEGLSLFGLLTSGWATILWLLLVLSLFILLARLRREIIKDDEVFHKLVTAFIDHKKLIAGMFAIASTTLLIALIAPPNTGDSMMYHMSRVVNWVQNRSVRHYPTYINRQLFFPPFAEFAILQFQLLTDSDRFANLVQWMSMTGSLITVCLIAKKLGANRTGQVLSAVYAVTTPMGILQSTSTQNDYVVTLWLTCFVYFSLVGLEINHLWNSAKVGISLGLAILTKATAYLYAFPFLGWYLLVKIRKRPRDFLKSVFLIAVAILMLNSGHYHRNFTWFGSPLGPADEIAGEVNGRLGLDVTFSNVIRNLTFHLGTISLINKGVKHAVFELHRLIGLDINDPSTTRVNTSYRMYPLNTSEDAAGNLLHFFLGVVCVLLILLHPKMRCRRKLLIYALMVSFAFVSFCSYLRWDPWRQRLHLPLFILTAPAVGVAVSELLSGRYVKILAYCLLISAFPWLLSNQSRPLVPIAPLSRNASILANDRVSQYFVKRPSLKSQYLEAVQVLNQTPCRVIGLVSGGNEWEYPLWVLLHETGAHFTIVHAPSALTEAQHLASDEVCALVYLGRGRGKVAKESGKANVYEWDYLTVVIRLGNQDRSLPALRVPTKGSSPPSCWTRIVRSVLRRKRHNISEVKETPCNHQGGVGNDRLCS